MRACVSHGLEAQGGKETGKKEGELQEKERKRAESIKRINKKSVYDECIRIYTNISHIGSKKTTFCYKSRGKFGQMSVP